MAKQLVKVDDSLREAWLQRIERLFDQVSDWLSDQPGYASSEPESKEVWEEELGVYQAPVLKIGTDAGEVILEPSARNYPGKGVVQLYSWPTLRRVRLLAEEDDSWTVLTDSHVPLRQEWNRENLITLIHDLAAWP